MIGRLPPGFSLLGAEETRSSLCLVSSDDLFGGSSIGGIFASGLSRDSLLPISSLLEPCAKLAEVPTAVSKAPRAAATGSPACPLETSTPPAPPTASAPIVTGAPVDALPAASILTPSQALHSAAAARMLPVLAPSRGGVFSPHSDSRCWTPGACTGAHGGPGGSSEKQSKGPQSPDEEKKQGTWSAEENRCFFDALSRFGRCFKSLHESVCATKSKDQVPPRLAHTGDAPASPLGACGPAILVRTVSPFSCVHTRARAVEKRLRPLLCVTSTAVVSTIWATAFSPELSEQRGQGGGEGTCYVRPHAALRSTRGAPKHSNVDSLLRTAKDAWLPLNPKNGLACRCGATITG